MATPTSGYSCRGDLERVEGGADRLPVSGVIHSETSIKHPAVDASRNIDRR